MTFLEMSYGFWIGGRRHVASVQRGYKNRHGCERKSLAEQYYYDAVGACGELAVAKLTGRYWPMGINDDKSKPDVAPDIQVRTLECHDYDLIVRPDDVPQHRYVLATGEPPQLLVHGWIWGYDAKAMKDRFFDRGDRKEPCYWIPQNCLNPIEDLIV